MMLEPIAKHRTRDGARIVVGLDQTNASGAYEILFDGPLSLSAEIKFDEVELDGGDIKFYRHHANSNGRIAIEAGTIENSDLGEVGEWLREQADRPEVTA